MCSRKDCLYYWFQDDEFKDKCVECNAQQGKTVHFENEGMFDTKADFEKWKVKIKKQKAKLGNKILICILCNEEFDSNVEGFASQYARGEGICDSCLESHSKTELLEAVW